MAIITIKDTTTFEVDFLSMYQELLRSFIISKILEYPVSAYNEEKQHQFDVLFVTPTNLASDYYKTDFFISSIIIDGLQINGKQDLDGSVYTDITSVDDQIYFTFED